MLWDVIQLLLHADDVDATTATSLNPVVATASITVVATSDEITPDVWTSKWVTEWMSEWVSEYCINASGLLIG